MEIGNYSIDELASFRKEYNCNLCGKVILLNEPATIIKPSYKSDPHLHFHRNCTIDLEVALTAHVNINRLPLKIAFGKKED